MKIQEQIEKEFKEALLNIKPYVSLKWLQKVEARFKSHKEELDLIEAGEEIRRHKKSQFSEILPPQYFEQIFMKKND